MQSKRILYVQYTNPCGYPPLEHSSRILADRGWDVLFLGIYSSGSSEKINFLPHPRITVRRWRSRAPGVRQKVHYLAFLLWVVASALRWRTDWIYASDLFACPAAALLHTFRYKVVYHEHDHPGTSTGSFLRLLGRVRSKVGQQSDVVVLPNETRRQRFIEETCRAGATLCVWNCPSRKEAAEEVITSAGELIVFYQGSIVPARVPMTLIHALAATPDNVRLRLAGYETIGHPMHLRELLKLAQTLGVSHRVDYLGALSRAELLPETRRAHVGLSLMPMRSGDLNEQTMVGASNKPFEYLACGCPLLVADLPEWRELFVAPDYARACDPGDVQSITAALRWFIEHPAETREMGERGRQRVVEEWNYETQFAPLLSILEG